MSADAINAKQLAHFRQTEHQQNLAPFRNRYRAKRPSAEMVASAAEQPQLSLTAYIKNHRAQPLATPQFDTTEASATWLGHACYLLLLDGVTIITDPVFSKRCSPSQWVGPKRYTPLPIHKADLPTIDIVLISHDHYDHLDLASVRYLAKRFNPVFLVPTGVDTWFRKRGISRVKACGWWDQVRVAGVDYYFLPTQHFSGRGVKRNTTLWGSWMVEHHAHRVYFAGDAGYSKDFTDIQQVFPSVDVALLPIGAYAPERIMGPVHCTPEQAVQIHKDLNATVSLAMHWGTFLLTLEPIDEPPKRLARARAEAGLAENAFRVPCHGETVILS